MFTVSIDPIILSVGHFALRWYSLIVLGAVVVGLRIAGRLAPRKGFSSDMISDLTLWMLPAGLAGARLFHVLDHWPHEYAADPVRVLYIWEGGLAIWGAVVGAL